MPKFFGAHVSAAGGLETAALAAKELGINSIQIHPSPPQQWNRSKYKVGIEDRFKAEKLNSLLEQVFFHAIYLINLATPDQLKLEQAKNSLVYYLELSARVAGSGVIVHVGSLKDEPDYETGYNRAAQAINWILDNSPSESRLILEVSAGSGRVIGSQLSELKEIYQRVKLQDRLGFGLDTQHMWASGYDWCNNFDQVCNEISEQFSWHKVWCIHLNDSLTELASRKDRHANIGEGLIGNQALKQLFMLPEANQIPFVLETPALKTLEGAAQEIAKLREFIAS